MKRLLLAVTFVIGLMFLASQDASPPESSPTPTVQSLDITSIDAPIDAPIDTSVAAPIDSQTQRELWVFTADWCAACKDYEVTLKKAEKRGVKIRRIDYDDYPELVKKYKIRVVPTTLVMQYDEEVEREEGSLSFSEIFKLLKTTIRTLLVNIFRLVLMAI